MSKFLKRFLSVVRAILAIAVEIWKDPIARQIIIWLVTKQAPALKSMSKAANRIPKSTFAAPRSMTIIEGLELVARLGLRRPACMSWLPIADMDAAWNGMGPRTWPEWLRNAVDSYARFLMILSLPHDMAFTFENDGTFAGWHVTQADWESNTKICLAEAAKTANWWQRKRQEFVAELVIQALRAGAFVAWKTAYCGNQNRAVS